MAEFHIRMWQEQTLIDSNDYIVTADTLEEAVEQLQALQDEAQDSSEHQAFPGNVLSFCEAHVRVLDPTEVVDSDSGITLVDEKGNRVRDLVGVPTGCTQLGRQLDDEPIIDIARRDAADRAYEDYEFPGRVEDSGGWEWSTPGNEFTRTIFYTNENGGDSVRGHFTVRFDESTAIVVECYHA